EEELEDAGALDEERASGPREDLAEAPLEPGPVDEEPSGTEPARADQGADDVLEETPADDVLEETPEFLRDNPDDDELWFEQGEPKDFDFK
nr:hypothetical protein [Actinomycetota bacterium]